VEENCTNGTRIPSFNSILKNLFDREYTVRVEDRFLTTDKGLDVQLRSTTSFCNNRAMELEIIAYILDKYQDDPSAKSQGAMLVGEFFKRYQGSASLFHDFKGDKRALTWNRGEFSLDLIDVDKRYKSNGIGNLAYDLSEYLFAKYLLEKQKEEGFINGVFAPLDDSKYNETKKFYLKKGFLILPARNDIETKKTVLYKPITAEAVLDNVKNRRFEKVEKVQEYME